MAKEDQGGRSTHPGPPAFHAGYRADGEVSVRQCGRLGIAAAFEAAMRSRAFNELRGKLPFVAYPALYKVAVVEDLHI